MPFWWTRLCDFSYMWLVVLSTEIEPLAAVAAQNGSTLYVWSTSIELFSWLEPSVSFNSDVSVLCKHVRIDGHHSFFFLSFLPSTSSLVRKLSLKKNEMCLFLKAVIGLMFILKIMTVWWLYENNTLNVLCIIITFFIYFIYVQNTIILTSLMAPLKENQPSIHKLKQKQQQNRKNEGEHAMQYMQ